MEAETRSEKISAMLERQLDSCDSVLATCVEHLSPNVAIDQWPLQRILGLMKTSTQLASVISKLEAQQRPKNREK